MPDSLLKAPSLIGISGKIGSGKDLVGKIIQYLSTDHGVNGTRTFEESLGKTDDKGWGYCNFTRYNSPYKIKKFADKLKDIVCLLIGCTRAQLEDRDFKESELSDEWSVIINTYGELSACEFPDNIAEVRKTTPRLLLQLIGTECGRKIIHPNIWVNALFADYNSYNIGTEETIGKSAGITWEEKSNWIITDVRFTNEANEIKLRGGTLLRVNRPCIICGGIGYHKLSCPENFKHHHQSEIDLDDYIHFDHVIDNDGSIEDLVEKIRNLKLF